MASLEGRWPQWGLMPARTANALAVTGRSLRWQLLQHAQAVTAAPNSRHFAVSRAFRTSLSAGPQNRRKLSDVSRSKHKLHLVRHAAGDKLSSLHALSYGRCTLRALCDTARTSCVCVLCWVT